MVLVSGSTTAQRKVRAVVLEQAAGRCQEPVDGGVCGGKVTAVMHLVPRSEGGATEPANMRALCADHALVRYGRPNPTGDRRHQDALPLWSAAAKTAHEQQLLDRAGHRCQAQLRGGGRCPDPATSTVTSDPLDADSDQHAPRHAVCDEHAHQQRGERVRLTLLQAGHKLLPPPARLTPGQARLVDLLDELGAPDTLGSSAAQRLLRSHGHSAGGTRVREAACRYRRARVGLHLVPAAASSDGDDAEDPPRPAAADLQCTSGAPEVSAPAAAARLAQLLAGLVDATRPDLPPVAVEHLQSAARDVHAAVGALLVTPWAVPTS